MGSLLRGKQVALVGWVGTLLSWGGEQQQCKCWDWQKKLVEVLPYVAGHSCSTALCHAWRLRVAELAAGCGELQSQAGKAVHAGFHFSSIFVKWSGCVVLGLQAFRSLGWNQTTLGHLQMKSAQLGAEQPGTGMWLSPSFPGTLLVTRHGCAKGWSKPLTPTCLSLIVVQRNIGAGAPEACEAAPSLMVPSGCFTVTAAFCLRWTLLCLFLLKGSCSLLFIWCQEQYSGQSGFLCWQAYFGRKLPYQQIISHRHFNLLQRANWAEVVEAGWTKADQFIQWMFSSLWHLDHVWYSWRTLWNPAFYFSNTWKK